MKLKTTNYTSPVKKIKSSYTPNKELGIGNPDEMHCANLKEIIKMRDQYIMVYGCVR